VSSLQSRYQSKIDSPVSTYGRSILSRSDIVYAIYTGIPITSFLYKNNTNPFEIRKFLSLNRVGSPFTDLVSGQLVKIESKPTFTRNPDLG
jgi:hypothetical protein